MNKDICVRCGEGVVNIRVGAIIIKDNKVLMVKNNRDLHIHVRPRYDKPVVLNGNTYTDSEFGHHYAVNKSGVIPENDREEVFIRLKEWLNR